MKRHPERPPEGLDPQLVHASMQRSTLDEMQPQIQAVSQSPIVSALLAAVSGLVAVLNERREILAINESLMGVLSHQRFTGLRLGEVLHCCHSVQTEGGCGTTEHCLSCGAAIAQAVCMLQNHPTEQLCNICTAQSDGGENLFYRIRATPITIENRRFILVFIADVSREQRSAALERIFLHDLRNTAQGLSLGAHMALQEAPASQHESALELAALTDRLVREIELQRRIISSELNQCESLSQPVRISQLLGELEGTCRRHPAALDRQILVHMPVSDQEIRSDALIIHRILVNMVINALESTQPGGLVWVKAVREDSKEIFTVWNSGSIPPEFALRVFQQNFSTKGGLGHGFGTYSMKILGEQILGGKVSFTSDTIKGTFFHLSLPVGLMDASGQIADSAQRAGGA